MQWLNKPLAVQVTNLIYTVVKQVVSGLSDQICTGVVQAVSGSSDQPYLYSGSTSRQRFK